MRRFVLCVAFWCCSCFLADRYIENNELVILIGFVALFVAVGIFVNSLKRGDWP